MELGSLGSRLSILQPRIWCCHPVGFFRSPVRRSAMAWYPLGFFPWPHWFLPGSWLHSSCVIGRSLFSPLRFVGESLFGFLKAALLSLLYPPHCASCGCSLHKGDNVENQHLCTRCWRGIKPPPEHLCPMCSHPMVGTTLCSNCHDRSWHLSSIVAASRYAGVAEELIKRFKYGRDRTLAPALGDLLFGAMSDPRLAGKPFDAVVPVPLHSLREREREFNQSALLAAMLSKRLGSPVHHLLRRVRSTDPQAGLDREERMRNLKGAFEIRKASVNGLSLLLVDDVTTTGTTLDACAEVLREAGAKEVCAVVVARG